jgi:hypothetical protein
MGLKGESKVHGNHRTISSSNLHLYVCKGSDMLFNTVKTCEFLMD